MILGTTDTTYVERGKYHRNEEKQNEKERISMMNVGTVRSTRFWRVTDSFLSDYFGLLPDTQLIIEDTSKLGNVSGNFTKHNTSAAESAQNLGR